MAKITRFFAFVVEDEAPDDEQIMAFKAPDGQWYPMIGTDWERADTFLPVADQLQRISGKQYRILKFRLSGEIKIKEKNKKWKIQPVPTVELSRLPKEKSSRLEKRPKQSRRRR